MRREAKKRKRWRVTLGGLMLVIAVIAPFLAAWRPMTRAEAIELATKAVSKQYPDARLDGLEVSYSHYQETNFTEVHFSRPGCVPFIVSFTGNSRTPVGVLRCAGHGSRPFYFNDGRYSYCFYPAPLNIAPGK